MTAVPLNPVSTPSVLATPAFQQYGPAGHAPPLTLAAAEAYCRELTKRHYENFTVASWMLPRDLRQPFANVYSYCRWADDLADEAASPQQSLELLSWWETQLTDCYAQGKATHPVFIALRETIKRFKLPQEPLANLLIAFRQDQHTTRYDTFAELHEYCRYSANPVGRLVLALGECHTEETERLSDSICTGLQLANHWQDISRDYQRGRIYLPQQTLAEFDCSEQELGQRRATPELKRAIASEVARARTYFEAGKPLVGLVSRQIRLEVKLFLAGGLAILDAIERLDYDVLQRRPTVGKWQKIRLLMAAMVHRQGGPPA